MRWCFATAAQPGLCFAILDEQTPERLTLWLQA
jgi:hypothetical protein